MSISLVQKRKKKKQNRRTKLIADISCIINAITKAYWQKNIQTFLKKKTNMEEVKYKRLAMGKKTSTIHFTYFNIYTSNHLIIEQDIDSEVFMKKKMPQYFKQKHLLQLRSCSTLQVKFLIFSMVLPMDATYTKGIQLVKRHPPSFVSLPLVVLFLTKIFML